MNYRCKPSDTSTKSTDITSCVAGQAMLAVWQQKLYQARLFTRQIKIYQSPCHVLLSHYKNKRYSLVE
ncbi:MAG: hypothetical protein KPI85_04315 [cyanobacterium endosymbiont of Epithemia adnata isolate EadnSB Bon19]